MRVIDAPSVVPAHPISGLPEIGTLSAMGTHIPEADARSTMDPRLRADGTECANETL